MTTPASLYESPRLAAGYAYARPPVHRHIIERVRQSLSLTARVARALDVGCGAGLSTAALDPLANMLVGLEPARVMLVHHHVVAPRASSLVGSAEELPFPGRIFDLIAAGGSVNYMDRERFFEEAARVLTPGGVLVIYDFSAGRRLHSGPELDDWFGTFERRYPSPGGYAIDARNLDYQRSGLKLWSYDEFEVAIPMSLSDYLAYVLTETGVELAISRGFPIEAIAQWCQETLIDVFGDRQRDVLFDSYVALVTHR